MGIIVGAGSLDNKAHLNVPVHFQRDIFGFDEGLVRQISGNGFKGLDIGCGDGGLVRSLVGGGVDFEGIDYVAPEEPYFMRQRITAMHPEEGSIPKPDNHYDMVVSFQNTVLNFAFRQLFSPDSESEDIDIRTHMIDRDANIYENKTGQFIVYEAARVLKPNGRFMVYPCLPKIEDTMGPFLRMQGIRCSLEGVDRKAAKDYVVWENPSDIPDEKYMESSQFYFMTVITKD